MKSSLNFLWEALSNSYGVVIGAESLSLVTVLVILHILLAILTLCLGDRTICDIIRPLRNIFQIDAQSLLEGIFEVFMAIPHAIFYYGELYIRTYILAFRVAFMVWISAIGGLFGFMLFIFFLSIILGQDIVTERGDLAQYALYFYYACCAYMFWRLDGKRLATNFRNAWRC